MEFILDTADIDAVKQLDELLTIDGVTTNPSIITRSGKQPEQVIKEFVEYLLPEQKFFVQVVSLTMSRCWKRLAIFAVFVPRIPT